MACAALPLEIAENNLTHCYYLAVHCRVDGEIRVATEEAPSGECYRCPVCQTLCHWCFLGEGGTLRVLPFWASSQDEAARRFWASLNKGGRRN
jgi:hypothetical protein